MSDEQLLKEIREQFDYASSEWADIRKEAAKDMRYRAGDPWDPKERAAREAAKRLCLTLDELGQYCNQAINTARQNKRAIRVVPAGNGATDDTAEKRAAIIRGIEYKSKATAAYITAFEGSIERSYGFVKLGMQFESPKSFNRELVVLPVPNPDVIYLDPDAKQSDWSDMEYAFEIDVYREGRFRTRWPKAKIQSFTPEHSRTAPAWFKGESSLQVASYWKVSKTPRDLIGFDDGSTAFLDEFQGARLDQRQERRYGNDTALLIAPTGQSFPVETREVEDPSVTQYFTNGLEILEEKPWAGKYIPIFPCFGKTLYVPDEAGSSKRHLLSLVRLARDPYMLYCYIRTCEAEVAGQVPKNLYLGYEGQFDTTTDWENINKTYTAYAEVRPTLTATGQAILPLPTRQNWEPQIQGMEMMAESAKRAIQSAMSMGSTSVGRHDSSVRSGVAIKELDEQAETGNYHFTDALDGMISHLGRACDDLLKTVYDTEREVPIRDKKDEPGKLKINGPVTDPDSGEVSHFRTDEGDHEVTISTGPSNDSQRDAVNEFTAELVRMPNAPPKAIALAIKMRNLGPLGDELAECFDPQPEDQQAIPPQVQQQMQAADQMVQALTAKVHELTDAAESKQAELESRERIALAQEETKRTIAFASLDQQQGLTLLKEELAAVKHRMDMLHQAEQQRADQEHQAGMAEQQAALQPPPAEAQPQV